MSDAIILSAQEFYYLGTLVKAKYCDFAYAALLSSNTDDYKILLSEAKNSLIKSEHIAEDLLGTVCISKELEDMLRPVFFGDTEVSVQVCTVQDEPVTVIDNYHFLDNEITKVEISDGQLKISKSDVDQINAEITDLAPSESKDIGSKSIDDDADVDKIIAIKYLKLDVLSIVSDFVEADGVIYKPVENDKLVAISRDEFLTSASSTAKGVA